MPRVTCGKCSRDLEFSGNDRPSFCAYCGQSLASTAIETTTEAWSGHEIKTIRGDETTDFVPRSGSKARDEVPERVERYQLIRQIGRGGMGTVYEAEDTRHGRKVALKIIAPGYIDSAGAVDRFRQEGRLASSLTHPRCVFVHEADEDENGRPFIAMELMTGDTLQDLVEKGGPLAIGDAVLKILDVAEGLREAHRLGLIHRDVKPSNCFLDGEGRVKVGDFGLSKSQAGSVHLTRTGSFLGTPLYASPEQVKVDPLDGRTDVYSTAATLFFLLTGRAPFDRGDASATMARIVTDPAPSVRQTRPEIPVSLDRAIRKALERDRDRRCRDFDEFRDSLLPFVPGHVTDARMSLRCTVYLIDYLINVVVVAILFYRVRSPAAEVIAEFLFTLAYFAVGDGMLGGTVGKKLARIQVVDLSGREPAGIRRSTLRAVVFLTLASLPWSLGAIEPDSWPARPLLWPMFCLVAEIIGLTILALPTLIRRNHRGLHDLVAGTRVVVLPRDDRRRTADARRTIGRERGSVSRPIGVMQSVGPYKIRGAVRWEPSRRVVAGEDSTLGREAWIVIRPKGSPPPDSVRREVARATRPRWLAGGDQNEGHWDAYVAPNGCPLSDFAGADGLPWRDARMILEDVADELAAACQERTLPPGLNVEQVWVQPDGRAILVDPLAIWDASTEQPPSEDNERALMLLRRVAALALEGGRYRTDLIPKTIRSPMPLHASALLRRLLGGPDAFVDVASFRAELDATRQLPTEVSRGQRAVNLAIVGLAVGIGLASTFLFFDAIHAGRFDPKSVDGPELPFSEVAAVRLSQAAWLCCFFPILWVVWDIATRGGLSLRFAGLGLVLDDGRVAPRWRAGLRAFVTWAPMAAFLFGSVWLGILVPKNDWLPRIPLYLAYAWPAIGAVLALVSPSRAPNDRLSGLQVVPR